MATRAEAATTMTSPAMNRLVFVLSLLGGVVAGYLWWAHAVHADVPCGGGRGCDVVAASPYSRFPFGSGPPVAAYGTALYLLLAGLAFARTLTGSPERDRALLSLIVFLAAAGTLASLFLTYLELFVIRALCLWCLVSQTLILALLGAAFWEWLRGRKATRPAGGMR
jgi:uncharacterized membrane protein